jgi:hypothetical protein
MTNFANSQTCGIRRHQEGSMFAIEAVGAEQFADLLGTEHPGSKNRLLHPGQRGLNCFGRSLQHMPVKEPQGAYGNKQGRGTVMLLPQQMEQVESQFRVGNLIRRSPEMPSELKNHTDIGVLRVAGQAADVCFIDEFLTEDSHTAVSLGRPLRPHNRAVGPRPTASPLQHRISSPASGLREAV